MDTDIPFRHLDLRKGALRTRTNITNNISNLVAPQTYSGPVPVDVEKKKDIISMLPLIDSIYHPFYHDLKTISKKKRQLDDSDTD